MIETPPTLSPVERLPDVVRVGGFDIRIIKWDDLAAAASQRWGEFSSVEQVIRIQRNMPSRFKAADTLFHEISHAIFWVYGVEDSDKEERVVSAFGSAWMQIHRDNPWLARWLLEVLQ